MNILTTSEVNEIIEKIRMGKRITRNERLYHDNIQGVRRENLIFAFTNEELEEYVKCKVNIKYFIENYCYVKKEDGSRGKINLRPYQKEIIDYYMKYNKILIFKSRQMGITVVMALIILHFITFNMNKNVMIVANKNDTVKEIIHKIKDIYKLLPFFLQRGVTNWNEKRLSFDNGSSIHSQARSKEPAIGFTIDLFYWDEVGSIPEHISIPYFNSIMPVLDSIPDCKIVLSSTARSNFLRNLVEKSRLPEDSPYWNGFKLISVYWWMIENRDEEWKRQQIRLLGGNENMWKTEYDLIFVD